MELHELVQHFAESEPALWETLRQHVTLPDAQHVYPRFDVVGHELSGLGCACGPSVEGGVVVHHALAE